MERGFSVRLSANVDQYVAAMAKARAATSSISAESVKNFEKLGGQMQRVGGQMTRMVTVPVLAAGAGMVAASLQWESSFASVSKTVDGTTGQLEALEAELRSMARSLPATHKEIAAVAAAAGQLGVKTEDIAGFSKVMIDLGETTNLTADEAATSIAQLMNIMGTAPADVGRLGASLVELGNNGASTERDIVQMAQRIAGAGEVIGLSEAEVLGFANALASVGIEVEAGGTAISKVMVDIAKAVATGSGDLGLFASTAGMSAQQFAAAFKADPAAAIVEFVGGLGEISAAGGNVFGVLDKIGLSDVRVSRALLGMAESGDLLARSLADGTRAWEENTALTEEAEKRYATSAAQLEVLRNQIVDVAIDLGGLMVPMLLDVVGAVAEAVRWFGQLPEPVQQTALGFAAVMAAMGPLVSIAGTVVKNFMLIRSAMVAVSTFMAANPWLVAAAAAAAVLGTVAVALATHESASETAAKKADEFYRTVQSGIGALDLQEIALSNAASAAGRYADALLSAPDQALRDTVMNVVPDEDLKRQSDYVKVMQQLALTLDDVTKVNRGGAAAQAELERIRRRALDTGLQEIGVGDQINGVYLEEAEKLAIVNAAREEYIRTGRISVEGASMMVGTWGSMAAAGTEFITMLQDQALAANMSAESAAELVRIGDLQAFAYLKGTGQLWALTEAEIAAAEARARLWTPADGLVAGQKDMFDTTEGLTEATGGLVDVLGLSEEEIAANAEAAKELQKQAAEATNGFEVLAAAASILEQALSQVFGGPGGEERAWNAYEDGIVRVGEALADNGDTLDRHTEKGRANREAVLDQLDTIAELGVAMVRNGSSTEDAAASMNLMTESLVDQMVQAGMSEEAARAFIAELGRTPEEVTAALGVAVDEQSRAQLEEMLADLGTIEAGAKSEIEALIDRRSFDEAIRLVDYLSRGGSFQLWINAPKNANPDHSADGRYVPAGANLLSTFGEAGPEAILPLDRPGRLRALLGDPRIGGPILAALGRGRTESMSPATGVWGATERQGLLDPFTVTASTTATAGKTAAGSGTDTDQVMANRFERGDLSAADYDAYLAERQASEEKFSTEEQAIWRIREGLIAAEKKAKDDELRAEQDRMAAKFELGEISAADYQAYLDGLLGSFAKYGADYMAVFGIIQQLNRDAAAEQQRLIDETAAAQKKATEDQFAAASAAKELVDATAAANEASAAYTDAGVKNYLYSVDKKRTPEERAQAAEELASAARQVAETAFRRRDAEANAAGLADGTRGWADSMRAALSADSAWSAANGRPDVAMAIDELLVGIPVFGTGGKIGGSPDGTILRAGENNSAEWILRDRQIAALVVAAGQQPSVWAGSRSSGGGAQVDLGGITAHVWVGTREITDIVKVEIERDSHETAARVMAGAR